MKELTYEKDPEQSAEYLGIYIFIFILFLIIFGLALLLSKFIN